MKRELLVSLSGGEAWVALKEDGIVAETMFERPGRGRIVGDVFLGRVDAVVPGIQAAFVDVGIEKSAFLHASDILGVAGGETAERRGGGRSSARSGPEGGGGRDGRGGEGGRKDEGRQGRVRPGRRGREAVLVQDVVERGQSVLVQATKEPMSTKGARVTTDISLAGRFLVYLPMSSHVGVSRKIGDRAERLRLRRMAAAVAGEGDGGVIVRTAGEELTEPKLAGEYRRLQERWEAIRRRAASESPPALLHEEAKLVSGVIRDVFTDKFDSVTIDDRATHEEVVEYVRAFAPELLGRVHLYEGDVPLFDQAGVNQELRRAFRRKVDLPGGGHVVIEQTEALVAVDVNTGSFADKKKSPEDTILETNLEAAREIATQLRLRDAGGIVVIDFIDMDVPEHRAAVVRELRNRVGRDRARTRVWEMSALGLVEMTRQRVRPSLLHALTEPCGECAGLGRVAVAATVLRDVERAVRKAAAAGEALLLARVHPRVVLHAMESQPDYARLLGKAARVRVDLRDDPLLRADQFRLLASRAETDVTEKYRE